MYAEHRRSSGDKPCCPLCRVDWGVTAVRALREVAIRLQGREGKGGGRLGRGGGNERNGAAVSDAASTRAALVPVTCRSCSVKVQAAFFRCLVCGPAGSWVSASNLTCSNLVEKLVEGSGTKCMERPRSIQHADPEPPFLTAGLENWVHSPRPTARTPIVRQSRMPPGEHHIHASSLHAVSTSRTCAEGVTP